MKRLEEKLHDLENIEDMVNDNDECSSSRNEDGENVELSSVGINVSAPFTCSIEEGGAIRRVRGKKGRMDQVLQFPDHLISAPLLPFCISK